MRKRILALIAIGGLALSASAWMGCSSSSSGGGSNLTFGNVNLAVGDGDNKGTTAHACPFYSKVLLYFNVLSTVASGTELAPDVVLDNVGSGVEWPRQMIFGDTNLIVGNHNSSYCGVNNNVLVFRDYADLSDGATPDLTLTGNGTAFSKVMGMAYSTLNDSLIVDDEGNNRVVIYNDLAGISGNPNPDVILTANISTPDGIATNEKDVSSADAVDLFVANNGNCSGNTDSVSIFRDISSLVSAATADVILHADKSFFDLDCCPKKIDVFNNILYVETEEDECGLFIFDNAAGLTDDALPSAVLPQAGGSALVAPLNVFVDPSNTLWVPSGNEDGEETYAVKGFSPANDFTQNGVTGLTSGQVAQVRLNDVKRSHMVVGAGNGFFFNNFASEEDNTNFGAVHIYLGSPSSDGDLPDAVIPGGAGDPADHLIWALSVAAQQVE